MLILPTQLFEYNEILNHVDTIYLIEEPYYFTKYKYHKQKLILHRSSMQYYKDYLKKYNVKYIEFKDVNTNFYIKIKSDSSNINIFDPVDHHILDLYTKIFGKKLIIHETPTFIETRKELDEYREKYTNKKNYYHDISFYKWQRRQLNILINKNKPVYNKWSFDKENRNPFTNNYNEIKLKEYDNDYIDDAIDYIEKHFPNNFGLTDNFIYPITHKEAKSHFKEFISKKFNTFGEFQDAVASDIIIGSHSNISCLLNIGLLTPIYVIHEVLKYYKLSNNKKKAIVFVEAFVRQIIGWRSYMRFIYIYHGKNNENNLNHTNKLSNNWYTANTNIPIIDDLIKKVEKYAYLHHIERLMYIGNFALITMIKPKEIYDWFMVCFIDSYAWVMYANVYAMSQYSTTSFSMMTRPYFSSTNYIKKMSDYKDSIIIINNKEYSWYDIWNGLYYNFINVHKNKLSKIYAVAMQVKYWNNMNDKDQKNHIKNANLYLKNY